MKSKVIKAFVIIIIIGIILVLMVSLTKSNNLEHSAFVVAIGIDKSPSDKEKILVTFQIIPPQVAQDSSTDLSKVISFSLDEYSINSAVGKIQNYVSTVVNFSHTRVLVFSEEIAKEGIIKYINAISSNTQFDTNMYLMVSTSTAKEYLEALPQKTEINPILYYNIIKNSQDYDSSTKTVTLTEFLKNYHSTYGNSIATLCSVLEPQNTPNEQGNGNSPTKESSDSSSKSDSNKKDSEKSNIKIGISGIAIFNKDAMVGSLDKELSAIYLMMSKKIKNTYININHPNKENTKKITSNIYLWQSKKRKIKIDLNSPTPTIDITIPINAAIVDTENLEFSFFDEVYLNNMRKYISDDLKEKTDVYFDKLQNKYQVDINDFHKLVRRKFLFKTAYTNYNWNEQFKRAIINVDFDITFISSGLSIKK